MAGATAGGHGHIGRGARVRWTCLRGGTGPLDQFQQCVVDFPLDRNVIVKACAGGGKSTTLALRARRMVERAGIPPEQILVLTFSTRSRDDLQDKLSRLLGPRSPKAQ